MCNAGSGATTSWAQIVGGPKRALRCGLAVVFLLALARCGSSSKQSITETTGGGNTSETTSEGQAATTEKPAAETAKLSVESGFSSEVDSIGTRSSSAGAVLTNPRTTQAACGVQVTFN